MRDGVLSVLSYRSYPGEQANDLGDMVDDGDDISVVSGKELDHETMSVITENIFKFGSKPVSRILIKVMDRQPRPTRFSGIFQTTIVMMAMIVMIWIYFKYSKHFYKYT